MSDAPRPAPPSNADLAHAPFLRDLKQQITGEVRSTRHDRMLYATDASIYQVEPLAVVIPASIADVTRSLR